MKKMTFIPCRIKLFFLRHVVSVLHARYDAALAVKNFQEKLLSLSRNSPQG